jgi:predicted HTH transcriptional regulator
MTDEEFAQILALGHETRGIEFKGPGPLSNGRLVAQVVRAVLGMANRRDGGSVIIGVEDNGNLLNPVGLSEADLATWEYDLIADQIARYADPSVSFEREIKEYNNARYVVLTIDEFSDIPVLCKRPYNNVLREGACYVRSRRKPETSEIPTSPDMRDLLELATEKGVIQYLERAQRVGLIVLPTITPSSTEQFERQRSDLDE